VNDADVVEEPTAGPPDTASHPRPGGSLFVLLHGWYDTVRGFCPTWEEWQVAVELLPVVEQEPDPT
jgi:hypothetical protein